MTSSRPPRRTPVPPPIGTSATELRDGVPWTTLTGCITPDGLRDSMARYRQLGGGPLWVFDALQTNRYTPPAIACALSIAEEASEVGGLRTVIVGTRSRIIRMGLAVLRMRASLLPHPVEYLDAQSPAELAARTKVWWSTFRREMRE